MSRPLKENSGDAIDRRSEGPATTSSADPGLTARQVKASNGTAAVIMVGALGPELPQREG